MYFTQTIIRLIFTKVNMFYISVLNVFLHLFAGKHVYDGIIKKCIKDLEEIFLKK